MTLTREQMTLLPGLLANAPPWARTQAFWVDFAVRATAQSLAADQDVFTPDSPVEYLYLVVDGEVQQTFGFAGEMWFCQDLGPGGFFGQQALFSSRHASRATTTADTLVFRLAAPDVRYLLERYPGLREFLLRETRAGRLRSIPLFESLSDDDIRWLAHLVEEIEVRAGAALPLASKPGVYVIDWGQVATRIPTGLGLPEMRLTAGNFLLTRDVARSPVPAMPGEPGSEARGIRAGAAVAVHSATASLKTKLFYLPDADFARVIRAFPLCRAPLGERLDIAAYLAEVPILRDDREVARAHLEHLAGYCGWAFVPAGQNITAQGAAGHSSVILLRGAALVSAVDDQGRLRPRSTLRPVAYFGESSLTEGAPRDDTVRAVQGESNAGGSSLMGAELLILDRRDLREAFADKPDLWGGNVRLPQAIQKVTQAQSKFDWLEPDEKVVWDDRGHWLWLVVPLALVLAAYALGGVLLARISFLPDLLSGGHWLGAVVVGLLLAAPIYLIIINYFDDYYVVTNRRVARRDRSLIFRDVRMDAPITMVQDVTLDATLIGRLFDYGDLTVRTASKTGDVRFGHVPEPDKARSFVLQERTGAVAASRVQAREMLRRGLATDLGLGLPVPGIDRLRALGPDAGPHGRRTLWQRLGLSGATPTGSGLPGWAAGLSPRWQHVLFGPPRPPRQRPTGEIVWHKSWTNFIARTILPLFFLGLLVLAWLIVAPFIRGLFNLESATPGLVGLVLFTLVLGWLAWQVADYWNDIYVVTDDKIIDIERKPLGLSLKQREGNLDRIQTVFVQQTGIMQTLLNYGNVVITTAAGDEGFTFLQVGSPKKVQRVIFQKMDAFRRRQEEKTTVERQRQLIEGLAVYHELRDGR